MAEPAQQIKWHKGTGYFPVRKDAVQELLNSGYYGENPDHIVALMQLLFSKQDYNTNGAIMGVFPEFRNTFENNVEKMLNGQLTPEQVLENTAKTTDELLEEYNEF
jgi:sn-glycerol 3-phosphate transport system substrate-binding protein